MKKLICVFVVCVMLVAIMPFGGMALTTGAGTEASPYIVSDYAELRSLMANAPTDGTVVYIKLGSDIQSKDIQNDYALTLTKKNQEVVLDLAGHAIIRSSDITVDPGVIRAKEGVLTIKDSVGTGGVYAKGRIESAISLSNIDMVYSDDGTINIYGGTYQAYFSNNVAVYNEGGRLYIYGGSFKGSGNGCGIFAAAGINVIYGGSFYADTDEGKAMYLGTDQYIELYNLTAYGNVDSNSAQNNLWQYIYPSGSVYIDGVKQNNKIATDEFIGDVIEIKTDVVDKISITIDAPVIGREMASEAFVPSGAGYSIYVEYGNHVIAWFQGDSFAEGVFEKGINYKVKIYVMVDSLIRPDICAEVNGNEAELTFTKEDEYDVCYYWVEYTFTTVIDPVLKSVNIGINTPVAGETAIAGTIYKGDKYNVSLDWHSSKNQADYGDLNGKAFPNGVCYATVYISANDFYKFSSDTRVVINGKEYTPQWVAGEKNPQYIMVSNIAFGGSESIKGDVNGNGAIDTMDYNLLKRAYFGTYAIADSAVGDINKNDTMDAMDYNLLKRVYFGTYTVG